MKSSEIKVGGLYRAKVNNILTTVRVDAIDDFGYSCTNTGSGRKCRMKTAAKFRAEAQSPTEGAGRLLKAMTGAATVQDAIEQTLEGKQSSDPIPVSVSAPASSTAVVAAPTVATSPSVNVPASLDSLFGGNSGADTSPHMIIEARAGTGKTTTLVEGLRFVLGGSSALTPSAQQDTVWREMCKSSGKVSSICFVAFNKSIATELQNRVPQGCQAMTMHSMGFRALQNCLGRKQVESWVVQDIILDLLGIGPRPQEPRNATFQQREAYKAELNRWFSEKKEKALIISAAEKLTSFCKMNLVGELVHGTYVVEPEELDALAGHYDLDLNGDRAEVFELVPKILTRCANPTTKINFDDMIWLPVILGLAISKYDVLLVDEAQDLNRCQQELALRAGRRLILCGDPKQAIYGFAGADSRSMDRMFDILAETDRGCVKVPLTVTRRCGKVIVEEARKLVPDFEAHESNGMGLISLMHMDHKNPTRPNYYVDSCASGDMVVCRVNGPLVSECFRFLKAGKKANIQGKDIGDGLVRLVEKMKTDDVPTLIRKLDDYFDAEERKEQAKKNPSEQRIINLQDRRDCLMCFMEGLTRVSEVIAKINSIFTDNEGVAGIRLSSIHKAKGLEADRVFFINSKDAPCPHPMAKTKWQQEQEDNLFYVAVTRAKNELVFVS